MSLFGRPERNAVAQQVADGLNLYQATMDAWVLTPGSQDLYDKVSAEIEPLSVEDREQAQKMRHVADDLFKVSMAEMEKRARLHR